MSEESLALDLAQHNPQGGADDLRLFEPRQVLELAEDFEIARSEAYSRSPYVVPVLGNQFSTVTFHNTLSDASTQKTVTNVWQTAIASALNK